MKTTTRTKRGATSTSTRTITTRVNNSYKKKHFEFIHAKTAGQVLAAPAAAAAAAAAAEAAKYRLG